MNKQGPGKIGWTDYTWNPIKGLCPVGCWYCYGRAMYKRFEKQWVQKPSMFMWTLHEPKSLQRPSKIFVCSTFELFHPITNSIAWGPDVSMRDLVFDVIEKNPQHTFQILTKMPENIDREMPDNVWLGVSVTCCEDLNRAYHLKKAKARVKFISFEPLLEPCCPVMECYDFLGWMIVGRLTGHGHKYDPRRSWIQDFVRAAKESHIPIFLKDNLREIWGPDLIQEFPA